MLQVLLAVDIVLALALVGVILLQRSEGGALGMGGGGSGAGFGGFMSARGAANLLTRATAILAAAFIAVTLVLSVLAGHRDDQTSVFDQDQPKGEESGLTTPLPGEEPATTKTDESSDELPAPDQGSSGDDKDDGGDGTGN